MGLIFVHEMGHWLEAKRQGLPVSAPLFIPFLGASIFLKEQPQNAWREFQLAFAGPLLGVARRTRRSTGRGGRGFEPAAAIAFLGFFINLFNLLRSSRSTAAGSSRPSTPRSGSLGLVGLLALVIYRPNGILVLILVFAAMELWQRWKTRQFAGVGRVLLGEAVAAPGRSVLVFRARHASSSACTRRTCRTASRWMRPEDS